MVLVFIAAMAIATIAGTTIWIVQRSSQWHRESLAQLAATSRVAATSAGEVEYALIGTGRPILISHGIMGGFDQSVVASELILGPGKQGIAVSRFGYLRSPLSNGRKTPEEQADAYAALLDQLGIEAAPVIGISGGGPAALQFALRYPRRCSAVILISAVTHRVPQLLRAAIIPYFRALIVSDAASWLMNAIYWRWPSAVLLQALSREERRSRPTAAEKREAIRLMATSVPMRPRWAGLTNDAEFLMSLETYPLETLRVPTLIVHGTRDSIVPLSHAEYAASSIPNAALMRLEGAGHFGAFLRPEETRLRIAEFLNGKQEERG